MTMTILHRMLCHTKEKTASRGHLAGKSHLKGKPSSRPDRRTAFPGWHLLDRRGHPCKWTSTTPSHCLHAAALDDPRSHAAIQRPSLTWRPIEHRQSADLPSQRRHHHTARPPAPPRLLTILPVPRLRRSADTHAYLHHRPWRTLTGPWLAHRTMPVQ